MRFYAQDRGARILVPSAYLLACVFQVLSAVRHPSTEHTIMSCCWGLTTLLSVFSLWGIYWKLTPQGILESRFFLMRRTIAYSNIQDVSPRRSNVSAQRSTRIEITVLHGKPVLASPFEFERFVSGLEQHADPSVIHV
jgi:hypothetical protein